MLSIAKLSAGQERYYLDEAGERVDVATSVGEGVEDYYLDPSEARGHWTGSASARLGLSGSVRPDGLRSLMAGISPADGCSLRHGGSPVKVAGYDLTFSAPKSVSVLFGTGGDDLQTTVRAAHDRAVQQALDYLERSAAALRRGKGGLLIEEIEGFVAAAFRHRSSRAGDPQLHTHCHRRESRARS